MTEIADILSGKGEDDENFPVASRVIAPAHRGPILAFYRFVRAADDVVDHPKLDRAEKHALIDRLEAALLGKGAPEPVAEPLRRALAARGLSARHALDLLTAFRRDIECQRYADWDDLVGYCRYSAMPVGRFVLDIHGEAVERWPANDALCAALQIINHLQDCAQDYRELDRVYLPADLLMRHGAEVAMLGAPRAPTALRAVIADCATRTRALLRESRRFSPSIADHRLALEVAAIQALAERLVDFLERRDPLCEPVHLGKPAAALSAIGAMARAGFCRFIGQGRARAPAMER